MARVGERVVTHTELEKHLAAMALRIDSILSFLVFDGSGNEIKNFMIQFGVSQIGAGATDVTFGKSFKTGTTPSVACFSATDRMIAYLTTPPVATKFTAKGRGDDGVAGSLYIYWIAIGERG